MIKFFRKIRYDLMEKNKTGKYLKYAIGEIILVVIGILLALQINTWNTERISDKKMITYLDNLKDDLKTDTLAFSHRINFYKDFLENKKKLLSLSHFENIPTDSLENIFFPTYGNYEINTTTFTKISNLGISEISKNDNLSRKIYEYYTSKLKYFNSIINWEIEQTQNEANYWFNNQDEYEVSNFFEFPQFQDVNTNRQNLIKLISNPKGRNYLNSDYERKQRVLSVYQNIKKRADSLILGIENELINK
jgi:uncharacterized protein DUF6090